MGVNELAAILESDDPAAGLRAVGALHRLAEQVEAHISQLGGHHASAVCGGRAR